MSFKKKVPAGNAVAFGGEEKRDMGCIENIDKACRLI